MAGKIEQVTVREMYNALGKAIKEGHGNKYLLCGCDNEGNGYYGCFCTISPMPECCMDLVTDSQVMDADKLMIIG